MLKYIFLSISIISAIQLQAQSIHDYIIEGNYNKVKELLDSGVSPNLSNSKYLSNRLPEYGKCLKSHLLDKVVKNHMKGDNIWNQDSKSPLIIVYDQDYCFKDNECQYPIYTAIITGNYDIVNLLIDYGASLNVLQPFYVQKSKRSYSLAGMKYIFENKWYLNPAESDNHPSVYFTPLSLLFTHKYIECQTKVTDVQKLIEKMISKGAVASLPRQALNNDADYFKGFNLLSIAILHNDYINASLLIRNNFYVNYYFGNKNFTMLQLARKYAKESIYSTPNDTIIIDLLKQKGAVESTKFYKTNYFFSKSKKTIDILSSYLQAGGNPNVNKLLTTLVKEEEYGAAQLLLDHRKYITAREMCFIIKAGDSLLIRTALQYAEDPHLMIKGNASRGKYTSPMLYAIKYENQWLVDEFIKKETSFNVNKDYLPACLSYAIVNKNRQLVTLLLSKIKDSSILNEPISSFFELGLFYKVGELNSVSGRNNLIEKYHSPFYRSLFANDLNIIKQLLAKGADINHSVVMNDYSYMQKGDWDAQKKKFTPYKESYIKQLNKDINSKNDTFTPFLFYCMKKGNDLEIIKLFIEEGVDINYKTPNSNISAAYFLGGEDQVEVLKYLVNEGLDINVFNLAEPQKPTLVWRYLRPGYKSYSQSEPKYDERFRYLIENGADLEIPCLMKENGKTYFLDGFKYVKKHREDLVNIIN